MSENGVPYMTIKFKTIRKIFFFLFFFDLYQTVNFSRAHRPLSTNRVTTYLIGTGPHLVPWL